MKKVGQVNYEINMPGRRKHKRVLHVNLLRRWYSSEDVCYLEEEDEGVDSVEEIPPWDGGVGEQCQREPVVLEGFADVLQNKPGQTNLTQHRIETGSARALRQPPYRLPYTHREVVLKELEEMEASGIIDQ